MFLASVRSKGNSLSLRPRYFGLGAAYGNSLRLRPRYFGLGAAYGNSLRLRQLPREGAGYHKIHVDGEISRPKDFIFTRYPGGTTPGSLAAATASAAVRPKGNSRVSRDTSASVRPMATPSAFGSSLAREPGVEISM